MMKHIKIQAAFMTVGLLLSAWTHATPTITFEGEVSTQTCQAVVNGEESAIVLLPTVSESNLATAGASAGLTPFTIALTGCATAGADTQISTKFLGHSVTAGGNLGNMAVHSPANNVAIQLTTDAAGTTPVVLNGSTTVPGLLLASGSTTANHQFGVQYVAEGGAVTAGAVTAVVEYTLSYQ